MSGKNLKAVTLVVYLTNLTKSVKDCCHIYKSPRITGTQITPHDAIKLFQFKYLSIK